MAQTIEVDLGAILKRIEDNLNRHIEITQKDLTDIKVNQAKLEGDVQNIQARLEGKIDTLQVEVQSIKEDVKDLKSIYKWVIGLLVSLMGLIITLTVGVGTILFKTSDLFPKG